jgi:hypothetical protein
VLREVGGICDCSSFLGEGLFELGGGKGEAVFWGWGCKGLFCFWVGNWRRWKSLERRGQVTRDLFGGSDLEY